ncbi:MAG: gamma-glutamylcyclotransferase [Gammaproteobacteria bacterium]|nr:gamma-glutamylcyclotransferase [Gammaproteobacteria bacterium]MDH5694257.1 gamma-glutamylcyclotransferase [Gammaproteobacteria bacterium]
MEFQWIRVKVYKHLFVYGTLRRDSLHRYKDLFRISTRYIGKATVKGCLVDLGTYPGLVIDDNESGLVHGDIYLVRRPKILFQRLDQYEEIGLQFPRPNAYQRRVVEVSTPQGIVQAYAYVFNRSPIGLKKISSGDYLKKFPWRYRK